MTNSEFLTLVSKLYKLPFEIVKKVDLKCRSDLDSMVDILDNLLDKKLESEKEEKYGQELQFSR